MFIIVSAERVVIDARHVGYAMPKTALCNDGILCLNTGIIDPGYTGLLSTTAINFEEGSYVIAPGDPFLRLVFHELDHGTKRDDDDYRVTAVTNVSDADYTQQRKRDSRRFPETFLNIPGQVEAITQKVLDRQTSQMVTMLTIFTVIFVLWNLGSYALLGRQVNDSSRSRAEVERLEAVLATMRRDMAELQQAVRAASATSASGMKQDTTPVQRRLGRRKP